MVAQDTSLKRKNLVLEGIPESSNGREDLRPTIYTLLDQMKVHKDTTYDMAYRVGPYNGGTKPRPIIVTFVKTTDRDEVYSKRINLKHSQAFSKVWVNEDMGQTARRKMNIIRMVARQAQAQGVQHKATKFSIQIGDEKYDERNLEDLPSHLSLDKIKTIAVNNDTLAYQSEHSYLSNLYPCKIRIGKQNYTSVEQAFHHIRAVTLKKPLAASRILLTRGPYDIMAIAKELHSTKEWDDCEDDIMYGCILKKFEQNPELLIKLLSTQHKELVEATPNTKWGAGATLSSNLIKNHTWRGDNKQGKILMTVRDILKLQNEEEEQEKKGQRETEKQGEKNNSEQETVSSANITQRKRSQTAKSKYEEPRDIAQEIKENQPQAQLHEEPTRRALPIPPLCDPGLEPSRGHREKPQAVTTDQQLLGNPLPPKDSASRHSTQTLHTGPDQRTTDNTTSTPQATSSRQYDQRKEKTQTPSRDFSPIYRYGQTSQTSQRQPRIVTTTTQKPRFR